MSINIKHYYKCAVLAGSLLFVSPNLNSTDLHVERNVYICYSKTAKKYHYDANCRGLNACTHRIMKVTISKAKSMGRTLCGWED